VGSAGGGADGHNPFRGLHHGGPVAQAGGGNDRIRRKLGAGDEAGISGGGNGVTTASGGYQTAHIGVGGGFHRSHHVRTGVFQKTFQAYLGLGDDGYGAGGQGVQGSLGAAFRQGGANHHRSGMLGHDFAQEGESIHAGHFNVQNDDIGPLALHVLHGEKGVGGGADDFDAGVGVEGLGDDLAHDGGVVHDHYFDFFCHGRWWRKGLEKQALGLAINGGLHRAEFVGNPVQGFRVPDNEIAA